MLNQSNRCLAQQTLLDLALEGDMAWEVTTADMNRKNELGHVRQCRKCLSKVLMAASPVTRFQTDTTLS